MTFFSVFIPVTLHLKKKKKKKLYMSISFLSDKNSPASGFETFNYCERFTRQYLRTWYEH